MKIKSKRAVEFVLKFKKYYAAKGWLKIIRQKGWVLDMCSVVLGFSNSLLSRLSLIRIVNVSKNGLLLKSHLRCMLNKGVYRLLRLSQLFDLLAYFSRNVVQRVGVWFLLNVRYLFLGVCYNSFLTGSLEQRYVYLNLCNAVRQRSLSQEWWLCLLEIESCSIT